MKKTNLYQPSVMSVWVLWFLGLLCPSTAKAQSLAKEPFDVNIQYILDAAEFKRCNPGVDFSYADISKADSGFVVVVHPRPYYAWNIPDIATVNPDHFRVWVEAGIKNENDRFKKLPLLTDGKQTFTHMDLERRNDQPFALFFNKNVIEELVPKNERGNRQTSLRFYFAKSIDAVYPMDKAEPLNHRKTVINYFLNYYSDKTLFLNVEGTYAAAADEYLEQNPDLQNCFNSDEISQGGGFFLKMQYERKHVLTHVIDRYINKKHYVILSLWKDEDHTIPLNFAYMKDNLLFADNIYTEESLTESRIERRYNYVAYPRSDFEDWTLFIPVQTINYWWRENIEPTKYNHTCYVFYTLTLSNDGKTPATGLPYESSGWFALDLPFSEESNTSKCEHDWIYEKGNRYTHSVPLSGGCTRDYDKYSVWMRCQKCGATTDYWSVMQPIGDRCVRHNLQEVNRREGSPFKLIDGNIIHTITPILITSACQNDCCNYKEHKTTYEEKTEYIHKPEEETCPPHEWIWEPARKVDEYRELKTINGERWIYYYDVLEQQSKCARCKQTNSLKHWSKFNHREKIEPPTPPTPPTRHEHVWYYFDKKFRENSTVTTKEVPSYQEDSLVIDFKPTPLTMTKWKNCYISTRPLLRQQWKALYQGSDDYIGISSEDFGVLNDITYQEAYDYIERLNDMTRDSLHIDMLFALPSVSEMRQLLKTGVVKPETDRGQTITSFYVDSIEVYDGKGRLVSQDKLATAPEGAKVRVMVGKMDKDGQLTMEDIESHDVQTAFFLKGVPTSSTTAERLFQPGRFYRLYFRQCVDCGKLELIPENVFRNMHYHNPIINK